MMVNRKIIYFKKLSLENWAQFQNNTFNFPEVDPNDKNSKIVYFLAENGVGKTRLFQAFRAVLFGDNDSSLSKFIDSELFELFPSQKKEKIKLKLKNNETIEPQNIALILEFVIIEISKKIKIKKFYKVERVWTYKDFSLHNNEIKYKVEKSLKIMEKAAGGVYIKINDLEKFNKLVNDIWPEEARDFYFFDGEKLQKMMEDPEKKEIKEKALKNSDFFPLDTHIIPYMEKIMNDFEKEKTRKPRKTEMLEEAEINIEKISKNLQKKKKVVQELTEDIEKASINLKHLKDEFSKIFNNKIQQMKKYEKIRPILLKIKDLKKKRENLYREIGNLMGDNKKKIYIFEWLLIYDILVDVMKDLKEKKKKNIIPTKIDKATIEYIKSLEYCICGNKITEKELKHLQKHQEKVVDEKLNEMATTFLNHLIDYYEKLPEIKNELIKKCEDFLKISENIENLTLEVPSYSSDINAELLETFIRMNEEITNLKNQIERKKEKQKQLNAEIETLEKDKTNWENLRINRKRQKERIEKSELYHLISRDCYFKLKHIRDKLKEKIIETIKYTTNKTFLELIPDPEKYIGVYIDNDWKFGFIHRDNPNTPIYDPSKGQFHVIGLSFLKSISKVAQHKVPLLFDTPFGRLSSRPKINIGKNLPKLFKGTQVFIFLTEEEARNMLDYISNKEGYELFNKSGYQITYEKIKNSQDLKERIKRIEKIKSIEIKTNLEEIF